MALPGRYSWRWTLLLLVLLGGTQAQEQTSQAPVCSEQGCQPPTQTPSPPLGATTGGSPLPTESPPPAGVTTFAPVGTPPAESPPPAGETIRLAPMSAPSAESAPSPPSVGSLPSPAPSETSCSDCSVTSPPSDQPPPPASERTPAPVAEPPPPSNATVAPPPDSFLFPSVPSPPPTEIPPPDNEPAPAPCPDCTPTEPPPPINVTDAAPPDGSPPPSGSRPPPVESSPPPAPAPAPQSEAVPPSSSLIPPPNVQPPSIVTLAPPPMINAAPPPPAGYSLPPPAAAGSPPNALIGPPPPIVDIPIPPPPTAASPIPFPPPLATPSSPPPTAMPVTPSPTTASPIFSPPTTTSPLLAPPATSRPVTPSPTTASPTLAPPTTAGPVSPPTTTVSPIVSTPGSASPTPPPEVPADTSGGAASPPPGGNSTAAPNSAGLLTAAPADPPTPTSPGPVTLAPSPPGTVAPPPLPLLTPFAPAANPFAPTSTPSAGPLQATSPPPDTPPLPPLATPTSPADAALPEGLPPFGQPSDTSPIPSPASPSPPALDVTSLPSPSPSSLVTDAVRNAGSETPSDTPTLTHSTAAPPPVSPPISNATLTPLPTSPASPLFFALDPTITIVSQPSPEPPFAPRAGPLEPLAAAPPATPVRAPTASPGSSTASPSAGLEPPTAAPAGPLPPAPSPSSLPPAGSQAPAAAPGASVLSNATPTSTDAPGASPRSVPASTGAAIGESVKAVPNQDTLAPTQATKATTLGQSVPPSLVTTTIENGQVTTSAVTTTGTLNSTLPVTTTSPSVPGSPAATVLPINGPVLVPTTPTGTVQIAANLVPASALKTHLIVLADGQTIAPDAYSQLMRTSVQSMMMSSPATATNSQQFSSATPADVGSLVFEPALAPFTNKPSQTMRFKATGATAQQCAAAGCTATCQLDDGPAIPCGSADGQVVLTGLTEGEHRLITALSTTAGSSLVAQHSALFTVDTVRPVVTVALEVGSPRVSTQVLDSVSTSFLVWDQAAPCPGYLLTSEPSPSITQASFRIDRGVVQNLRQDEAVTQQARRRLLQEGGQTGAGPVGYRFEVVPVGLGPSLMTVVVRSGGFEDRAGNDVNLTPDASATVYYDASRPQPVVSRADAGRPGLSTDVHVTLLVDFGQPVTGFDPFAVSVTNGRLTGFVEDRTHSASQLYLLDFSIEPLRTLTVQVAANAAQDYAGHLSLASNTFEVLHYEPSAALVSALRAAGGATVGLTALAAVTSGPWGITNGVTNMGLFAASTKLAAPLPPNYVTAADSLQFALWKWTCPFTALTFVGRDGSAPEPEADGSQTSTAALDRTGAADSGPPKPGGGRRLLRADSVVTRVLCGSRFPDEVKRLERARVFAHRRALLQAAGPAATNTSLATLPNNQTVPVTVVARAPGTNSTSRELPSSQYQSLLSQVKQLANFLQGNLPSSDNTGLREFFCVLFWIMVLLVGMSVFHLLLYRFVRKKDALPDIVVFPSIELTLLTTALVAIVTACTVVIAQGSRLGIIVGSLVLLLPLTYLLWVAAHVHSHVVKHKSVAFVVKAPSSDEDANASDGDGPPAHQSRGWVSRWFEASFAGEAQGEWEPVHRRRHRFFTARYGLFFDDLTGMPVERQGSTFSRHVHHTSPALRQRRQGTESRAGGGRQDSSGSEGGESPVAGSPAEIGTAGSDAVEAPAARLGLLPRVQEFRHEYAAHLRPYYITAQLTFSVLEAIVLASWAGSEHSWAQLFLVFVLKASLAALLFLLMPFKEARYQFAEVLNVVCDVISALLSFVLFGLNRRDSGLGIALIVLQGLPIVAIAVNGCVSVVGVVRRKVWPVAQRALSKVWRKTPAPREPQNDNSSEVTQTVDVVVKTDETK